MGTIGHISEILSKLHKKIVKVWLFCELKYPAGYGTIVSTKGAKPNNERKKKNEKSSIESINKNR